MLLLSARSVIFVTMIDLELDPQIMIWVVIPIFCMMVGFTVIKRFALILLKRRTPVQSPEEAREDEYILYAQKLRENGAVLSNYSAEAKYIAQELRKGSYLAKPDTGITGLLSPRGMETTFNGLRLQAFTFLPQAIIMQWISLFFPGLIVLKLPFPLTARFKEMFQSGINTRELDVRWVSSISWYILLFLTLDSIVGLFIPQFTFQPQRQVMTLDICKGMATELELAKPKSSLNGVIKRVIDMK